ncbi:15123_t:CDS:2, partial [Racocetra persica]
MQTETKRRIALPAPFMRPHYDVVVIGSGYGGAIAACRMSRAGKKVALLERGKERWPGEYPTKPLECLKEMQYSSVARHIGKKTGMYHFYNGSGQDAFVGCGQAYHRVWEMEIWPEDIEYEEIRRGYELAQQMLEPVSYPESSPDFPKLKALEKLAEELECPERFKRPPITVTFENRINAAGVKQKKSTLTGTTLQGLMMEDEREAFTVDSHQSLFFVTADIIFLAAGTLGTNEILLRSKANGLEISSELGR